MLTKRKVFFELFQKGVVECYIERNQHSEVNFTQLVQQKFGRIFRLFFELGELMLSSQSFLIKSDYVLGAGRSRCTYICLEKFSLKSVSVDCDLLLEMGYIVEKSVVKCTGGF